METYLEKIHHHKDGSIASCPRTSRTMNPVASKLKLNFNVLDEWICYPVWPNLAQAAVHHHVDN
jgi:hypothetical protein